MNVLHYHHHQNNPTRCDKFTLWLPGGFKTALHYLRQSSILKDKLILLPGYPDRVMQCCVSGKVRAHPKTKELYPRKSASLELAEEIGFHISPKDLTDQKILRDMPFLKRGELQHHHQLFYYSFLLTEEKIREDMTPLIEFKKTTIDSYDDRVCLFIGIEKENLDLIRKRKQLACKTDTAGESLILMPYSMLLEILEKHQEEMCQIVDINLPVHTTSVIE